MKTGSTSLRAGAAAALAAALLGTLAGAARAEFPTVLSAPTVSGVMMEGETVQAQSGRWSGEPPFTYQYDWQRCNNGGGDCVLIGVPKGESYTLTAADIGYRIRTWVTMTGQDCGEWNTFHVRQCRTAENQAPSEQTAVVLANPKFLPRNAVAPTLTGIAEEGETLRAADGSWTGLEPLTIVRQWQQCGAGGDGCQTILGATADSYTLAARDIGKTIRVVVTAKNARGEAVVASAVTDVVAALRPRAGRTTIDVGKVVPPYRLVIDRFTATPTPVRARVPVTVRFRVSDTRGFRIQGAIVRILGVPPGVIGVVPDARTGPDGWATLRLRPSGRVVFRAGFAIDLLVRALRQGESAVSAQKRVKLALGAPRG